jgi:Tfp pilus assembly major pilin PilA
MQDILHKYSFKYVFFWHAYIACPCNYLEFIVGSAIALANRKNGGVGLMFTRYGNHGFFILLLSLLFIMYSNIAAAFSDARFENTTDKGNFGESVTDAIMEKRSLKKIPTKHAGNQGIDGAYVQYDNNSNVEKIILVESKVDSSPYNPDQMSDEKIRDQIEKMKKSNDPDVRKAGEFLEKKFDKIVKECHCHDSHNGKTTVSEIDKNGKLTKAKAEYNSQRVMRKLLEAKDRLKRSLTNQDKTPEQTTASTSTESAATLAKTTEKIKIKPMPKTSNVAQIQNHIVNGKITPLSTLKMAGKIAVPVQIAVLSYESGKVAKQIIQHEKVETHDLGLACAGTLSGTSAAYGGAAAGAALGSLIFPGPGTVAGGIIGGLTAGISGTILGEIAFDEAAKLMN